MKTLRFGIDFIDTHLNDFSEKGIYLFSESRSFIRYSFIYHLLSYNQNIKAPCLFLTGIDLAYGTDYIKKKIHDLVRYDFLTILEIPVFLRHIVNDTNDLAHILNDFDLYVKNINPELIIIQNIEYFFSESNTKTDTTLLMFILQYLKRYDATIIIDISNLNLKNKIEFDKFVNGSFEFVFLGKNKNYQLTYKGFKTSKDNFSLIFSFDAEFNVTVPLFKNTYSLNIENCKYVVMMKDFELYVEFFNEVFYHQIEYIFFSTLDELFELNIDSKHSLIILPTYHKDFIVWSSIPLVRRKYPHSKILLPGSFNISAAQKVRAMRLGADKYISLPFTLDSLKNALNEVYETEESEQHKFFSHNIIYSSLDLLKGFKSKIILKKSLARFIKEYAFELISKGMSLHFYKSIIKIDIVDLGDLIRHNKQLIFVGTYYLDKDQAILLIYKNLNTSQYSDIMLDIAQNLKPYVEVKTPENKQNKTLSTLNTLNLLSKRETIMNNVENINYPLDESDIDVVLDWIYWGIK